jgi:hypothetical protein
MGKLPVGDWLLAACWHFFLVSVCIVEAKASYHACHHGLLIVFGLLHLFGCPID